MADTRKRLTARGYNPKSGSFGKSADPYLMNQPRRPGSEPSVTQYESGNPSSWAEDPTSVDTWKQEYAKGRDEVGMGNFLDSTWKEREQMPPGPYDKAAATEAALKAAAVERQAAFENARRLASKAYNLATAMFPQADELFRTNQARDFMAMGESALDTTIARIIDAGEESEEEEETEAEEEGKKASEVNIASLRKDLNEIKASADAKKHASIIASLESRLAALEVVAEDEEDVEDEESEDEEGKKASDEVANRLAALNAGLDSLFARKASDEEEEEEEEEGKKASEEEETEAEEKEETEEGKKASSKVASIDDEFMIELGPPEMDSLPDSHSDLLDDIFTAHETRTASSEPKKGVSKLGGGSKVSSASPSGLDNLSYLWKSDPDLSGDFR